MPAYHRSVFLFVLVGSGISCDSSVNPTVVKPTPLAEQLSLSTKAISLVVGQARQLSVSRSSSQTTWQSDNPAVISVSPTGLVSARTPGIAHAVVRSQNAADTATITVRGPIARVQLALDTVNIAANQSASLEFHVLDSSDSLIDNGDIDSKIVWTSTKPSIATVDSAGRVSAFVVGRTEIALSIDGRADTTTVNVVDVPVATVALSAPNRIGLTPGSNYRIVALAKDISGNELPGRTFNWSSSDMRVASVSSSGVVTAITPGSSQILVTSEGHSASVDVIVWPPTVAAVSVSLAATTIDTGRTTQATAVAYDASGRVLTGRTVAWSSDNPAAASVSSLGVVKGAGVGAAAITALVDGVAGSAKIAVGVSSNGTPGSVPISTLSVSLPVSSLGIGQTAQATAIPRDSAGNTLTGRSIAWSTSNSNVATVSEGGVVTAIAAGAATITALSEGKSASVTVSVAGSSPTPAAIATIVVSLSASSVAVGQTTQGTATARDSAGNLLTGSTFSWSSSNPSIAAVSSTGIVTALASGSATIVASSQNHVGSSVVNVSAGAPSVTGILVSHDFEDGTLGPYWNPWGTAIDVVDDPTGGGHGKVARIHYAALSADDNKALSPKTGFGIGLGDSVWFSGDFYLPAEVNDEPVTSMRKLNYWGSVNDSYHFKENFGMVLTLQGSQLEVANTAVGPSNSPTDFTYTSAFVTKGRWHRLEIELKVNSNFAARDGVLRIWVDGAKIYDHTNVRWTDPLWTEDPTTYKWESWGMGFQMQSPSPFDEYRYWDNMTFSKTRLQQ